MNRRVLVLTYFWPPAGGVGVQRTLKFVEHLPAAGWDATVVAPRGAAYRIVDQSLLSAVDPSVPVHRAACLEPAGLRSVIRAAMRPGSPLSLSGAAATTGPGVRRAVGLRSLVNDAWAAWVRTCFVPDEQMAWIPVAAATAARVARDESVSSIYSSSPPPSTHLAAGIAKSLTGLPWVADLRDPWVGNAFAPEQPVLRRRMEQWLERWVITKADRVVFATPRLRDRYASRYPRLAHRFAVITNGYDRRELGEPQPTVAQPGDVGHPFRLLYAGSVYGDRELAIFLDGLALALGRDASLRTRLRIEFIGWMSVPNRRLAEERLEGLAPVLEIGGFVPRAEALAKVRAADAGMLLLADGPDRDLFIGAKLFESIGLDRQIFAMAPPGDTRAVLEELDWGVIADPTPAGVADGLKRIVSGPSPRRPADPDGRYERRALARSLAEVLDAVSRRTG